VVAGADAPLPHVLVGSQLLGERAVTPGERLAFPSLAKGDAKRVWLVSFPLDGFSKAGAHLLGGSTVVAEADAPLPHVLVGSQLLGERAVTPGERLAFPSLAKGDAKRVWLVSFPLDGFSKAGEGWTLRFLLLSLGLRGTIGGPDRPQFWQ
jgi:hypothetical protein